MGVPVRGVRDSRFRPARKHPWAFASPAHPPMTPLMRLRWRYVHSLCLGAGFIMLPASAEAESRSVCGFFHRDHLSASQQLRHSHIPSAARQHAPESMIKRKLARHRASPTSRFAVRRATIAESLGLGHHFSDHVLGQAATRPAAFAHNQDIPARFRDMSEGFRMRHACWCQDTRF